MAIFEIVLTASSIVTTAICIWDSNLPWHERAQSAARFWGGLSHLFAANGSALESTCPNVPFSHQKGRENQYHERRRDRGSRF